MTSFFPHFSYSRPFVIRYSNLFSLFTKTLLAIHCLCFQISFRFFIFSFYFFFCICHIRIWAISISSFSFTFPACLFPSPLLQLFHCFVLCKKIDSCISLKFSKSGCFVFALATHVIFIVSFILNELREALKTYFILCECICCCAKSFIYVFSFGSTSKFSLIVTGVTVNKTHIHSTASRKKEHKVYKKKNVRSKMPRKPQNVVETKAVKDSNFDFSL